MTLGSGMQQMLQARYLPNDGYSRSNICDLCIYDRHEFLENCGNNLGKPQAAASLSETIEKLGLKTAIEKSRLVSLKEILLMNIFLINYFLKKKFGKQNLKVLLC